MLLQPLARDTPLGATQYQLWQYVEAAWRLLYLKETSKSSLNLCRGVWQWLQPTMVATLTTDFFIIYKSQEVVILMVWQRFQNDGNVSRCYSTGHPRVTTPNEDQYLAVTAKRNRQSTASDLSRQISLATGTTVSRQTAYRRLGTLVYMLVGLSDVFHLPQLFVTSD
ncbi:HTH_Tnp_Tc3_2 domain-containing protein [Trichonephila clavipes]|nr:HTH_Tnp_Tc3_2 domain-containing protein [Trichonephila clavipes]